MKLTAQYDRQIAKLSLSVRRAWIEISPVRHMKRNEVSLSVRRAWIEMYRMSGPVYRVCVALREESVD